jgi:hypothetical protein
MNKKLSTPLLRITGLYALAAYGGLGYEKPQSALRAFVRFFSATFLQPWSLLRKALIWAAKTSHTAGTLGAMLNGNMVDFFVFIK